MFHLGMSETGLCNARTTLGLYRHTCTNSAIRVQTLSKWNHSSPIGKFLDDTGETIRMTGYLGNQYSAVFGELVKMKLEQDAPALIKAMRQVRAISKEHADLATVYAKLPTEDGRPVETHYDLFNALTRGAQDMARVQDREKAEGNALSLFTSPGGLYAELRNNAAKHRVREPLVGIN